MGALAGYRALFGAGFRRQSTYRAALVTGSLANLFFGLFRSAIFLSLYRQRHAVAGLDRGAALTYVWLLQVLFGVIFTTWMWEFPEGVRSGAFVSDLLRPGDPLARLLAVDMGRSTFAFVARGLPQLVVAGVFFRLRLPVTMTGWVALAVSFTLVMAMAFELRFLIGSISFWTPDFRGWWSLLFSAIWLGAGIVVPIEYFPPLLRTVASHSPLAALLQLPVRVATGRGVGAALLLQAGWVLVVGLGCRAVMAVAERRLVIHGG